ncbi:ATP-grasp domain-containing protein [Rhodanobacter sp. Col0626]|uniref:ATP-grasp domain-containing protein n=1 Tax=Rhodanobacter sp. Col0626 TaxID=3415679 RepID=UPI003CE7CAD9
MEAFPLVILAHVCHPAVTDGFLPAAERLGLPVILLTDHRLEHLAYFSARTAAMPMQVIECDVFNPLAVIDLLRGAGISPAAVFSNSDHLQTAAAVVAAAFTLPGKDWRTCYAAKNKAAMRERLRERGLPCPWFHNLMPGQVFPSDAPWPLVAKPREGVASQDVRLCEDAQALQRYADAFWQRHPGRALLLEQRLEGPLFTVESLSDGRQTQLVGGFDVRLSEPPHFVELEARWNAVAGRDLREQALAQVLAFGVDFGVCHSEFVLTGKGPVLVEINYRSIGDGREFLLDRMFERSWFETILELHLGKPLSPLQPTWREALVRYYVADRGGRLRRAIGATRTAMASAQIDYAPLRAEGDNIELSHSNKDYLGRLSVIAEDSGELDRALTAIEPSLQWEIEPGRESLAGEAA